MDIQSTAQINGFEDLNIDVVDFSGNRIRNVSTMKYTKMRVLCLRNNALTNVKEVVGLYDVQMKELDLSNENTN